MQNQHSAPRGSKTNRLLTSSTCTYSLCTYSRPTSQTQSSLPSSRRYSSPLMARLRGCRSRLGSKKPRPVPAAPVPAAGHSMLLGHAGNIPPETSQSTRHKRKVDQLTIGGPESDSPGEHREKPPLPPPAAQEASCQAPTLFNTPILSSSVS